MHRFVCDVCGMELEHPGERYIVRIEQVPSSYSSRVRTWDLCRECSDRLREQMDERGRQCTTTS